MSKNRKSGNTLASNLLRRASGASQTVDSASRLKQALALHQQGQLAQAEALYREVLAQEPRNVNALNFLGMLQHQAVNSKSALALLAQAVKLQPDHAPARNNQALALRKLGQHEASATSYERALLLKPDYAEAWVNFANVLRNLQRPQEAVTACQRALSIRPDLVHALNTQGAALNDMRRHEAALACYARAIALAPGFANAHFNRGVAFGELKMHDQALQSYALALRYDAGNEIAWNNQGVILDELHRHEEATVCYARALQIKPDYVEAHLNQGTALEELHQHGAALQCFARAIAINPADVNAHAARGHCLFSLERYGDAAKAFSTVVQHAPLHPFARGHLFDALSRTADWARLPSLAAELNADVKMGRPTVMPFSYLAVQDKAADQLRCAQTYMSHQFPEAVVPLYDGEAYTHKRIRVAYLSADFHDHATAHLMAEVFEAHNREHFEFTALSFGPDRADPMRERSKCGFHQFIDVTTLSDAQIAQWLHDQKIDVAVDLKGHTQDSRPSIFTYRGAPVQVNFLGYPGTLGASHWDYIITYHWLASPGSEDDFSEQLVRLPHCYQPNRAHKPLNTHTPSRAEFGLPDESLVFCSFNPSYKITLAMFDVWMRLLKAIEGSVLWLLVDTPEVMQRLRQTAESQGVEAQRMVFAPRLPLTGHLARLPAADLFLDTLPINAHTTTSDALWAGLPVLTCSGQSMAGRVAGSLLRTVGLPELVTENMADYEMLAQRLAGNPELLQGLKTRLEGNRLTHPLFDPVRFARDLEHAYLHMVSRHRQGAAPQRFDVPRARTPDACCNALVALSNERGFQLRLRLQFPLWLACRFDSAYRGNHLLHSIFLKLAFGVALAGAEDHYSHLTFERQHP